MNIVFYYSSSIHRYDWECVTMKSLWTHSRSPALSSGNLICMSFLSSSVLTGLHGAAFCETLMYILFFLSLQWIALREMFLCITRTSTSLNRHDVFFPKIVVYSPSFHSKPIWLRRIWLNSQKLLFHPITVNGDWGFPTLKAPIVSNNLHINWCTMSHVF